MEPQNRYLVTRSVAALTGTSPSFWNQRRVRGDGPPFIKFGSRVLYQLTEVEERLAKRTKRSTGEFEQ
jgi:predicted DNA-binding transcriptional regulator AlpA